MGFMQESWAPANRVAAGCAGAALMLAGLRRGGVRGTVAALPGLLLLARAVTNVDTARLVRMKTSIETGTPAHDAAARIE